MSVRLWRRVRLGLAQYARHQHLDPKRVSRALHALHQLKPLCGNASHSRKALYHLGCALLENRPHILVPVCPDYSHHHGKFTGQGLGSGVPLLLQLHTQFLRRLKKWIPRMRVTFLLADHEADVPELVAALGITQKEFRARTQCSIKASASFLHRSHWRVVSMRQQIPSFKQRKDQEVDALLADRSLQPHLINLMEARASFYQRIGYHSDIWFERTVKTSAEYLVLAAYAREKHAIVCSHSTVNLCWYIGTALLHNPIKVY